MIPSKKRLPTLATSAFAILLLSYVGYLLINQYLHYQQMNLAVIENLSHEAKSQAEAVSYFFSERKKDILLLSNSRPMSLFFENKALGMSMTYGLKASLVEIENKLIKMVSDSNIRGTPIYRRILFYPVNLPFIIDSMGNTVEKPPLIDKIKAQTKRDAPKLISHRSKMAVATAYYYKGQIQGHFVAWINPTTIYDHFLNNHDEFGRFTGLLSEKDNFYFTEEMPLMLINYGIRHIRDAADSTPFQFNASLTNQKEMAMTGLRIPVDDSGFTLFLIIPSHTISNLINPWLTLSVLSLLLIIFLFGAFVSWKITIKNMLLGAKYEESEKQNLVIEGKNRQLKKAKEELKAINQNLESLVSERTKALEKSLSELKEAQLQLVQSEKMASIGQLAAGVAHEINNPVGFVKSNLNSIKTYCKDMVQVVTIFEKLEDLITKQMLPETDPSISSLIEEISKLKEAVDLEYIFEDYISVIDESVDGMNRIARIVQDLKEFSHVDKAEVTLFNINDGIESTLNIVKNELKQKATVVKELNATTPVRCYPQRINQVLMNLFINAAQAIEVKGEILIATKNVGQNIEIIVRDNGCGIPDAHLTKIFDPFFTTKEVGVGTGLGLNMAYNIVKRHKGQITVTSQVNAGTTFRVILLSNPSF